MCTVQTMRGNKRVFFLIRISIRFVRAPELFALLPLAVTNISLE